MRVKRFALAGLLTLLLTAFEMTWIMTILAGCFQRPGSGFEEKPVMSQEVDDLTTSPGCAVGTVRYPTDVADMGNIYAGRTFYADGNHLGHDIALAEGAAIHPVGCGIVRVYRAANGYGRLVVVIEHRLESSVTVKNGVGEDTEVKYFLTIYGHLRRGKNRQQTIGALPWKSGDTVHPDDVIGYVDDEAENGDGAEHLHLGVRLQRAVEAEGVDASWFRGYDTKPSQRKQFADPAIFMPVLMGQAQAVFWHPPGTVMLRQKDGSAWMAEKSYSRSAIENGTLYGEGLDIRAVSVTDEELKCLDTAGTYFSPRAGHKVVKFDDATTVYEYTGLGVGEWRKAFITQEAYYSWGWKQADLEVWPASKRQSFFAETEDMGYQTLRDGALVKGNKESEVCMVSQGKRRPFVDWETFTLLGYRPELIVVLPQNVLDEVAGPRGDLITFADTQKCAYPANCPGGDLELCQGSDLDPSQNDPPEDDSPSQSSSGETDSNQNNNTTSAPPQSTTSDSSGTGGLDETPIKSSYVHLHYTGPVEPGLIEFQGMWDPPGLEFYDWTPSTFMLCQDDKSGDGYLDCDLPAPSGTVNLIFTLHLPSGRWWGDLSCSPDGGCGQTIGTVTLTNAEGYVPYVLKSNGSGPEFNNGFVAVVP